MTTHKNVLPQQHLGMRTLPASIALALWLTGCAGTRQYDEGMRLIADGQPEAAFNALKEASKQDPNNAQIRIDLLKLVQSHSRELYQRGEEARLAGNAGAAREYFNRIQAMEPGSPQARLGLLRLNLDQRSARNIADAQRLTSEGQLDAARDKLTSALAENPGHRETLRQLNALDEKLQTLRNEKAERSAAQSIMRAPVTLQFRDANLRMVFEALSRSTGLNVIVDRDVRADLRTTIFVKDAPIEDTVDLILLQNQLEKRAVNANTLFVYPATPAKQKEYQDLQVRTVQIANADVKYLTTVLKTVLKIKEVSADERSGTLVMRDTADALAVATKVIAAHDVPEPEIMLEVEVLEVANDRLTNLGLQFPDAITLSTPTGASGKLTLGDLQALSRDDVLITPLSIGLNLKLQDTAANILASPRIRARNKEKARILIGDRVPTITNTVTPVQSGSGVVTGSVQYQDVGLKLEFEPQVYSDQDVGIRINLEVSTIVKEISGPSGSLAYQIGTRNAQTVVRLRDGETQVLGGLISSDDRNTAAKLPGLGQLPILGKLFSNNAGADNKTEIVLSITPHILRMPAVLEAGVRTVYSGTEAGMRERPLQLDPIAGARLQSNSATPSTLATNNTPKPSAAPPTFAPSFAPSLAPNLAIMPTPTAPPEPATAASPVVTAPAATPLRQLLPTMNSARGMGAPGPTPIPTPSPAPAPNAASSGATPPPAQ